MEHLPEEFQDAPREEQVQIAQLGLQSWSILKKEVGKVKDLDYTKLVEKFKEEGRKEGKREGEREAKPHERTDGGGDALARALPAHRPASALSCGAFHHVDGR